LLFLFLIPKKNTTHYVLDTTIRKQTQTRHELSYKQLEVKTNRTSFLFGNHNQHHNTELIALQTVFIHIFVVPTDIQCMTCN